ncbi:hypothetical protein D3C74_369690 [compost metagenome]
MLQRFTALVQGNQSGGACGINDLIGAGQIKEKGNPSRNKAGKIAGHGQLVGRVNELLIQSGRVVVPSNEHPCLGSIYFFAHITGIFNRFSGNFQHQALMGVHELGFLGGQAKIFGIERIDFFQIASFAVYGLPHYFSQ